MDFSEISKILELISVFLLIMFAVFMLSQNIGKPASRLFLASFFLSRAIILLSFAFYHYENAPKSIPDLLVIGESFLFLYAPLLYLFVQSATCNKFRFRWYYMFHFTPFLIMLTYFLVSFHFLPFAEKTASLLNRSLYHPVINDTLWLWGQFLMYAFATIYLLFRYKKRIKKYNSNYNHNLFSWMSFLVIAFIVWKAIFISGYLFRFFEGDYWIAFKIFIEVCFLFYTSMIIYKGMQLPYSMNTNGNGKMYQTSPLTIENKQQYHERLKMIMENEKPFLEPGITLNELARRCKVPIHYLSQILNEEVKMNFYNYINYYRIKEAGNLLSMPENDEKTILEILYHVGFNSKSVFNTAFKKHYKMTPREYRRQHSRVIAA